MYVTGLPVSGLLSGVFHGDWLNSEYVPDPGVPPPYDDDSDVGLSTPGENSDLRAQSTSCQQIVAMSTQSCVQTAESSRPIEDCFDFKSSLRPYYFTAKLFDM